jgi:glycosyltransferase involved in cell wall biosynthesis
MVSYFFPPVGGPAALRPLKFAKYLPDYRWKPIVLSARNPDWYYAHDPELLHEVPAYAEVERSLMFRSSWLYRLLNPLRNSKLETLIRRYVFHPDEQIGWIPFACLKTLKIIRRHNIKAIYSTSRPFSCHLIGYYAKKRTGLPWVADFQDEWFENPDLVLPTAFHRRIHYGLERLVVRNADKVTAMTPTFCKLLSKHSSQNDKFHTITGGYDTDDFKGLYLKGNRGGQSDRFIIAFTGMFYGSFRPNRLLEMINELIDERMIPANRIKIRFVGANDPRDIDFEDHHRICEFTGYLPHREAIRHLSNASALLLLLSEERGRGVIPSKTFEYLAAGRPVLALVPPSGDAANIICETKTGFVVDFRDGKAIKDSVLRFYKDWSKGMRDFRPDRKAIAAFDLRNLTGDLAALLDEIVHSRAAEAIRK